MLLNKLPLLTVIPFSDSIINGYCSTFFVKAIWMVIQFSFIHILVIHPICFIFSEVPALYNALDQSQDCTQFSQYLASQVQVTWVSNLNSLELCFMLKNDLKQWMKQERNRTGFARSMFSSRWTKEFPNI